MSLSENERCEQMENGIPMLFGYDHKPFFGICSMKLTEKLYSFFNVPHIGISRMFDFHKSIEIFKQLISHINHFINHVNERDDAWHPGTIVDSPPRSPGGGPIRRTGAPPPPRGFPSRPAGPQRRVGSGRRRCSVWKPQRGRRDFQDLSLSRWYPFLFFPISYSSS